MHTAIRLAGGLSLLACASLAQATTYDVSATFADGGIQRQTVFTGSFDWNAGTQTVSNFTGLLSESMWSWDAAQATFTMTGSAGMSAAGYTQYVYSTSYGQGDAPLLDLTHQLAASVSGDLVTVTTFLQNSTDAVSGGGYAVTGGNATPYGNSNAFFTLVFNTADITNTSATLTQIVYGDFSPLGLMGPMLTGMAGMTGYDGGGSMGGYPISLSITAVPVPAAAWLFGSGLTGWCAAGLRKSARRRG